MLNWVGAIMQFFNPSQEMPQLTSMKLKDFYNLCCNGLAFFYIIYLYCGKDENIKPDASRMYQYP